MQHPTTPTVVPRAEAASNRLGDEHSLPPASSGVVLVVAIQRVYRETVRAELLSRGMVTIGTSSELHGLELAGRGRLFDAILVDAGSLQALDMDFLCQLHQHCPDLPIVVSTPSDERTFGIEGRDSGVFQCVSKSSPPEMLSDAMCAAVASSRTARMQNR